MKHFSTEFPQKSISNNTFVSAVIQWLRGVKGSKILDNAGEIDLDSAAPFIKSSNGEELRLRSLDEANGQKAVGFRHDLPDADGRLWRTEAVLRHCVGRNGQDLVRLRTQCIARTATARIDIPRKPYLIKSLLSNGWGGSDGLLTVSDQPNWISDDLEGLLLAQAAIGGEASSYLPIIYLSAFTRSEWALPRNSIEQMAYELGGITHVIAEPDRSFSFKLKNITAGENVYGGAIGVILPGRGLIRRFLIGGYYPNPRDLQNVLSSFVSSLRSQMPAEGWDWTELQEQALRQQRERERNRLTTSDVEALYEEEIANLKEQIEQLKSQITQPDAVVGADPEEGLLPASIAQHIGSEIYPGEVMDRLRLAAKAALSHAEQDGLDSRSRAVLERFSTLNSSIGLINLLGDIKRATRDSRRMCQELTELLCRHGYNEKPRGKHVVLEARDGFDGMEALTLSTTPSDARSLKNMQKQVERAIGITKLREGKL